MEPEVKTTLDGEIATTTARMRCVEVEVTWNAKTFEEISYIEKINYDPELVRSSEQFIPKEAPVSFEDWKKTH